MDIDTEQPPPEDTHTPAVQRRRGCSAPPSCRCTPLKRFRVEGLSPEELEDPAIAEIARRLQVARHHRHVMREVDHQCAREARAFDDSNGEDEFKLSNPELRKHIKFDMLSCAKQSAEEILAWCRRHDDYFELVPMSEKAKIKTTVTHMKHLARQWTEVRDREGRTGKKPKIRSWAVWKAELLKNYLLADHTLQCWTTFH